jgi:hypothetical protein
MPYGNPTGYLPGYGAPTDPALSLLAMLRRSNSPYADRPGAAGTAGYPTMRASQIPAGPLPPPLYARDNGGGGFDPVSFMRDGGRGGMNPLGMAGRGAAAGPSTPMPAMASDFGFGWSGMPPVASDLGFGASNSAIGAEAAPIGMEWAGAPAAAGNKGAAGGAGGLGGAAGMAGPAGAGMGTGYVASKAGAPDWLSALIGASTAAALFLSDRRTKTDIVPIARLPSGAMLYRFRYRHRPGVQFGVMADEIGRLRPEAVSEVGGVRFVDYAVAA